MAEPAEDGGDLEGLVEEAAHGNEASWWLLWQQVEVTLAKIVGSPRVTGRLSQSEDDVRNILVSVMEKLRDDDGRRLQQYVDRRAADPSLEFVPWLIVVAKRVAIDYMRAHDEYLDKRRTRNEGSAAGAWIAPGTLPPDSRLGGARPPVTTRGAAMAMLRYAYESLPPEQVAALELWILNTSYPDMAAELGMADARDAERAVRAALERLRRRFRDA